MDVNGYIHRIKECMVAEEPHNEERLDLIKNISLTTMAEGFSMHPAWNDLSNPDSDLVSFLKLECKGDGDKLSVHKLRAIAVLWCDGDNKERVVEFYENMQDGLQNEIAATDKDFKPNFFALLDFATEMVFRLEPYYMGTERVITEEKVNEVR